MWIRARLHTSRARGKQCFIVLRQREYSVQVLINVSEKVSKAMVKFSSGWVQFLSVLHHVFKLYVIFNVDTKLRHLVLEQINKVLLIN